MATAITTFQSRDGKKFDTELEATAHETALEMEADITRFVELAELGQAEATRARKYISGFAAMLAADEHA